MKSYETVSNENSVGYSNLLKPRNATIKYRDGHMENDVQMMYSDILFSPIYAIHFFANFYHGRIVIF